MSKPGTSVFTISPVLVLPKDGCSHFARCHPSERKPSAQTHVYAKGICQVFFFRKTSEIILLLVIPTMAF